MAKQEQTTDVIEKPNTAVALGDDQFAEDAGSGFEEAGAGAYAIPFLQILQSGSPQCKKSDGKYIKGAEEGFLYNTVTQELYDGSKGITVIPCYFTQRYVEWQPRENGGGFVAEHLEPLPTRKDSKGRDILANGNNLVDTRNHYVMIENPDGTLTAALIAMSSTQLKKSRQWMSKMQGIQIKTPRGAATAPMASRKYKLTTVPESNDKGTWYGWKIELVGITDDPEQYNAAKAFRAAVQKGEAKSQQQSGDGSTGESF